MKKSVIIIVAVVVLATIWGIIFWYASNNAGQKGSHYEVQGVKVDVLQQGKEEGAKQGDIMTVNYTIALPDGKQVYSTYTNNRTFTFTLGGTSNVKLLPGWEVGLLGAKVGEKRKLVIPSSMAYGKNGVPGVIPPNTNLTYEIEVMRIVPGTAAAPTQTKSPY